MLFQRPKDQCEQEYLSLRDPVVQKQLELFSECFAIMTCLESLKGPRKGSPSGYTLFCVSLLKLYISVENWVVNTLTLSYLKPKP